MESDLQPHPSDNKIHIVPKISHYLCPANTHSALICSCNGYSACVRGRPIRWEQYKPYDATVIYVPFFEMNLQKTFSPDCNNVTSQYSHAWPHINLCIQTEILQMAARWGILVGTQNWYEIWSVPVGHNHNVNLFIFSNWRTNVNMFPSCSCWIVSCLTINT